MTEAELENFVSSKKYEPEVTLALQQMVLDIRNETTQYGTLEGVPTAMQANVRNQMYLTSETLRLMAKSGGPQMSAADAKIVANYTGYLDKATKFIPGWVKVAVALALGLGTMMGWKRIVVTVGEKIGKEHLTYAQGASAELVAMGTILAADTFGLPVSTTHVLSSSVAGTMAANRSGLHGPTIRNITAAWVFTLPVGGAAIGHALLALQHDRSLTFCQLDTTAAVRRAVLLCGDSPRVALWVDMLTSDTNHEPES